MKATPYPLDSVRVLDLGQYISGPAAAVLLAEFGADVIKIEPPDGDPFRQWGAQLNASFVAFNRGKRSVVLDLKTEDGLAGFYELVQDVDVLIENFKPGVTERLGIGYLAVKKHNPKIIYCSITGFGSTGPRAHLPAYDGVALGYSGFASQLLDPGDPLLRGPAMADVVTGQAAVLSILAALIARSRSEEGAHLEISMLGALVHFLHSAVAKKIMDEFEEGPVTRAQSSQAFAFVASDGKLLLIHLSSPPKFWDGLCAALAHPALEADPRFASRPDRQKNYAELRAELQKIFGSRTRDAWLKALQENGVPCAPVNSISEALADEQLRHLGIIDEIEEPGLGPMPQIRPPVLWDGEVLPPVQRAPLLGEHTDELIGEGSTSSRPTTAEIR